jgi:Flp pilus assembly protein TadG
VTLAPHFRCFRKRQQGQAAVEFALVVVSLVILLISMLEMTMFIYTYVALTNAAKEGVRYAVVHGASAASPSGPGSSTNVVSKVQSFANASLHSLSSDNISVTYPNGNSPGNAVQVTVSYAYKPIFGLRWASVTISANSVGRIMF